MECPKCQTENPDESYFCSSCGNPLQELPESNSGWFWVFVLILILGSVYYVFDRWYQPDRQIPKSQVSALEQPIRELEPLGSSSRSSKKPLQSPPSPETVNFDVGRVIIKDVTGRPIAEISVPVLAGGWIALPVRACLGGIEWVIELGVDQLSIVDGILNDNDDVALWRVQSDAVIDGPEISPWNSELPLKWLSLDLIEAPEPLQLSTLETQGFFLKGTLSQVFEGPGVLIQDGRVVGWGFGGLIEGVYVWTGDEGKDLITNIRVDDFYRLRFANSREEEFARSLAMSEGYSGLEQLETLANGFRFEPKLTETETPAHLQSEAIVAFMRSLIKQLMQDGYTREVAGIFDASLLIEIDNAVLVTEVVQATAAGYGYEDAIQMTEEVIGGINPSKNQEIQQLRQFLSRLYQDWLNRLIENGDTPKGWQAFERGRQNLPDDLEIHLFGVRLALEENDWAAAEELLQMREYPPSLLDQVQSLQARISELKVMSGRIVIYFEPGTRHIPVTATLGQAVQQKFIVDTGAEMVTIPYATARELGLMIDGRNPMRKVYTASGFVTAPEVVLPSITLDGWEVYNVEALVLDLPNQTGLGLLGMTYLRRFRVDINSQEGVLMLDPR